MRGVLYLLLALVVACTTRTEQWELPNGYRVFAASPSEVYVANPGRELLVGPALESVGVSGDLIVAFCGQKPVVGSGFPNTVGFNIVDTRTGEVRSSLSAEEVAAEMARRGHAMPSLMPPQRLKPIASSRD